MATQWHKAHCSTRLLLHSLVFSCFALAKQTSALSFPANQVDTILVNMPDMWKSTQKLGNHFIMSSLKLNHLHQKSLWSYGWMEVQAYRTQVEMYIFQITNWAVFRPRLLVSCGRFLSWTWPMEVYLIASEYPLNSWPNFLLSGCFRLTGPRTNRLKRNPFSWNKGVKWAFLYKHCPQTDSQICWHLSSCKYYLSGKSSRCWF